MRTTESYLIRALTNLHPGSGLTDFGIIDKHVQRDPTTGLPIIFASSLKGALRELFNTHPAVDATTELEIFGSDVKGKLLEQSTGNSNNTTSTDKPNTVQGSYRFLDAYLLALPVRSSKNFFYPATCPALIADFLQHLAQIDHPKAANWRSRLQPLATEISSAFYYDDQCQDTIRMEDISVAPYNNQVPQPSINALAELFLAHRFAILPTTDFQRLAEDLPTVARNYLNDGISENLWYEEIVPREARFYASLIRPTSDQNTFSHHLNETFKKTIQVGGNATVGYGLCQMTKI